MTRASENPGDACGELHHNVELEEEKEEERSTKTIPRRDEPRSLPPGPTVTPGRNRDLFRISKRTGEKRDAHGIPARRFLPLSPFPPGWGATRELEINEHVIERVRPWENSPHFSPLFHGEANGVCTSARFGVAV